MRGSLVWIGSNLNCDGITLDQGWITERSGVSYNRIFNTENLFVPGKHNILNAMTAVACSRDMGIDNSPISKGLSLFKELPHRLEFVGEHNGVKFYNDSKATTPEATVAAVNAFDRNVIPILGGYDKGVEFDYMASQIADKIRWAAVIGATAGIISEALKKAGVQTTIFNSLEEALEGCIARAREGNIILLSPACASYDMFSDYEHRGETFKSLVLEHIANSK